MTTVEIWHNPRCTKSRQTLALLEEHELEPTIVLYLEKPPSQARLKTVVKLLGGDVQTLLRSQEADYKALGLKEASTAECIKAMTAHPKVIERPVVIVKNGATEHAAIGRPPSNVLDILP